MAHCYASRLGNCATKIEKEHYVSHGVLKIIGKTFTIVGADWLGTSPKTISAKRFAARVLCTTHHRLLSPLDEAAKRVFKAILDFNAELSLPVPVPPHCEVTVSGWDFERWVLKLYCGMHAAGHLRDAGPIPGYVIDSVFNRQRLPMDLGLYLEGNLGDLVTVGNTLAIRPLSRPDNGETVALVIALAGVGFRCAIRPARDGGSGSVDGRERRVPGIRMEDQRSGCSRELTLEW